MAQAGTLTANIAFKGASQRAVWQQTFDDFKKAHPDIDVKVSFVDEEAYKVQLPGWLTTVAPDIVNWHNGERMAYYAQRGLFEDLTPRLEQERLERSSMRRRKKRRRIRASNTPRRPCTTRGACSIARTCSRRPASRPSRKHGMNSSTPARS